jgi:hypothetical protein
MMTERNDQDETRTEPKRSLRTCAGCGKHAAPEALVRVVLDPSSGELAVDLGRSSFGRGAHVHPAAPCVTRASRGGFARVFKTKVSSTPEAIGRGIVEGADRRIEGLLGGAKRGKLLAIGADAVTDALKEGKAALVVVAADAAAAAALPEVQKAVVAGKAIAWNDKARLGALFGRDEVAVVAVLHEGVAAEIASSHGTSLPFRSEAWWSEVR